MAEDKDLMQSLLELLSGDEDKGSSESFAEPNEFAPQNETSATEGLDLAGILKMASVLSELGAEDDRSRLLYAIKPFLSEEKRPQVDSALKLLRLIKAAEAAGKMDLLKDFKL